MSAALPIRVGRDQQAKRAVLRGQALIAVTHGAAKASGKSSGAFFGDDADGCADARSGDPWEAGASFSVSVFRSPYAAAGHGTARDGTFGKRGWIDRHDSHHDGTPWAEDHTAEVERLHAPEPAPERSWQPTRTK